MLRRNMKRKNEEKGITLIALVITVIVLLILAWVTISTLSGENGILKQATNANTKTAHANVMEQLQLEADTYIIDKSTGEISSTLIGYLQSKQIIGDEIGEDSGEYQINVTKLLSTAPKYGKGTATESEKKRCIHIRRTRRNRGKSNI